MSLLRFKTALFLVAFLSLLQAQAPDRIRVRGEIVTPEAFIQDSLQIELRALDGRTTLPSAVVHSDGSFDISGVEPGTYNAVVISSQGMTVYTSLVQVSAMNNQITLRIGSATPRETTNGSVSFHRLSHKVPKAARQEFERAHERSERNQPAKALAHLQKAVEIDPDYLEAHNNLGTLYIKVGNLEAAHRHLVRAVELEPGAPEAHCNLGALALKERDPVAAEQHVRRAMLLGGDSLLTAYLLGLALASQNRTAEAMPLLEEVAPRVPHARQVLAILKGRPPAPATAYRQR